MARTKVPPIATQDSTSHIEKGVGSSESQETSSSSFTSFSSTPTCPNCSNIFAELSDMDFRSHVAACSRPSTAESVGTITTSGSSLSPPPISLENVYASAKYLSNKDGPRPDLHFDYNAAQEPAIAIADADADEEDFDPEDHDRIQPYIDPNSEFDYYDQAEGHEEHDVDINDPDIGLKFKYPKLPPVEHFEKYLKNPSEMPYDELYKRAAIVSTKRRTGLPSNWTGDDLVATAKHYAVELKLKTPEWTAFIDQYHQDDEFRLRLESLRDPQFRAKLQRQAFVREQEKQKLKQKELKESRERKAGRLIDPTKWDDMKQAEVYGFEYSSHPKHVGAQPIPSASRKRGVGEIDMSEGRSGRAQRMATRKMYDQSTPEDESDGLPAKRQRKVRVLDDAIGELSKSPRKQSRSQTPIRRTFPSGKPIGRPPKSLSKLKDVQLASGEDETILEDESIKDEDISRHLLPAEQEQLQQSAELLVNQIAEELPVEPVVKKKHAGGRPRKHPLPVPAPVAVVDVIKPAEQITTAVSETPSAIVPPIKPKAKVIKPKKQPAKSAKSGGRVKKEANVEPSAETEEENAILPTTEHDDDSDSEATEAINSRRDSSSSQSTISSYGDRQINRSSTHEQTLTREPRTATRNRAAASVEKSTSIQESPKKAVRGKRNSRSSETPVANSQLLKARKPRGKQATIEEDEEVDPSHEPIIKKEATPAAHPIISPSSSRTKRKRTVEVNSDAPTAPSASPTKKARKGRPTKSSSAPSEGPLIISASSSKIKINKRAKGPLARILPPREPSTRARRAPKAIRNTDDANEDDEDEDELQMPATEYERYQALADPRSPITLGKRIRKSVIDLRTAMEGGDDEDGDDEFEG
ncbi:uncharacterized protein EAF02_002806 [Botrytis sinoallii]|uniref:uncharacterized protein n=1 Tax=Botrytis sinoallii TaxID=1463999 RepID=UPI0018FF99CE|nr:uncharacterized protein EAF02_002806 [Botrytis sinoallii]KAF7888265.1 hypothetical protein EAF02_002806 [Botrytis sinoallii]